MKKLLVILLCGAILAPAGAWGQQWIEPHYTSDGTFVEGHWQTPAEGREKSQATPGQVNPYTGQVTPFSPTSPGPRTVNPSPLPYDPRNPQPYQAYQPYQQDFRFPTK
jgi:hypothetical protein